ncbi:hypothetical protein I588_01131 [Enterococcus pallens ATCC BAA-351]|uniref:RelE/StbE family addiction module toxin n=2 Tax=Enterococcus pallens TaxID=160454 RepID=R2S826_9ENTE|nr:RelE/StbE family addiction module toxin [Enterococcus pallens ATCC BAA-351]EOU25143.1 hypothetical protein I588_01131 [Enterococcus pallens ATCC BAA-351]
MVKEKRFRVWRIGGIRPTMKIRETPIFKRDFKRIKKKHYDMTKLKTAVNLIVSQDKQLLVRKYKDHSLVGNW